MWRSLFGTVTLQMISADIAGALERLTKWNIAVSRIHYLDDLTVQITVMRTDYRRVNESLQKSGCKISVIRRNGLYWQLKDLLHRPVLTIGVLMYLFFLLSVPGKVFFLQVEGNSAVPTRQILEAAQSSGIHFGANRREVRSEKVKNALLEKIPELQWAGVNTNGCVAVITVRERREADAETEKIFGSIVAARDGILQQITVTKGTQLCTLGQAVKAGDILISAYKDYGISLKLTGAEGDIFGQTERKLEAVTPASLQLRSQIGATERKYSLIIGKKQINFFKDSGISHPSCVKMYKRTYIVLPGGFTLPVALVTQEIIRYDTVVRQLEDFSFLESVCRNYLQSIMTDGTILQQEYSLTADDTVCRFSASYSCREQIGLTIKEEHIYRDE